MPLTFHVGARTSAPVWPETPTSGLGLPTLQARKLQNQKMKSYIFPFLDFSIISLLLYLPTPPPPHLIRDNNKHFSFSLPLKIMGLLNYKSNVTILAVN